MNMNVQPNNGLEKGTCFITNEKYKNRILFINWFNDDGKSLAYPSYNVDNSGYLLVELTCDIPFYVETNYIKENKRRKLYFYNEEGRGLFDDINPLSSPSCT